MWLWRKFPHLVLGNYLPLAYQSGQPPLKISSNFYDVFSLPQGWVVDLSELDTRFRKLQQQFHPDRYASNSEIEKRRAVQMASMINQAYETLKNPLSRAQYLLQLLDFDVAQESHITSDAQFLMDQMLLREALSDLKSDPKPKQALESLAIDAEQKYLHLQQQFAQQFDASDYTAAFDTVAKMQFADKFAADIDQLKDELEEL
jgi:molecular chaperone HscB